MDITKQALRDALGFTTDVELAAFFGISKVAVGAWGDTVPEGRQWQVRALRPDLFDVPRGKESANAV